MKTAISVPDGVFREADQLARKLGKSRSELYATALRAYLDAHRRDDVTARLNQVYATEPAAVDPALAEMQAASVPGSDW